MLHYTGTKKAFSSFQACLWLVKVQGNVWQQFIAVDLELGEKAWMKTKVELVYGLKVPLYLDSKPCIISDVSLYNKAMQAGI